MIKKIKILSTEDLYKIRLEGKLTPYQTDLLARREELEKELQNPFLYQKYFKKYCITCSNPIQGNWEWYQTHGNFCQDCGTFADKLATGKIIRHYCNNCKTKMYIFMPDVESLKNLRQHNVYKITRGKFCPSCNMVNIVRKIISKPSKLTKKYDQPQKKRTNQTGEGNKLSV